MHLGQLVAAFVANASGVLCSKPEAQLALIANDASNTPCNIPGGACDSDYKAGQHTLRKQGDDICASRGEKQWSGAIDVSDERRLFFWFAESRDDPKNDPVVVLMGGGPGASSMITLFENVGPCKVQDDLTTRPNPLAWNNHASLLVLDQPAGVGFSTRAPGSPAPSTDTDPAEDFQKFLNVFFTDIFPVKAHLPINLVSGSYGGHFIPTYLDHILESRRYRATNAFHGNITSVRLTSPLIDFGALALGTYDLLCVDHAGNGFFDDNDCHKLAEAYPECEKRRKSCLATPDTNICKSMMDYCAEHMVKPYSDKGGNMLDVTLRCENDNPLDCLVGLGATPKYLNQPHILEKLGLPRDFTFNPWDLDMRAAYVESGSVAQPMASKINSILDAYKEPGNIGDIRMLVVTGRNDPTCNVAGNKLAFGDVPWSGQAEFCSKPWQPLRQNVNDTGEWRGTEDGRLVFMALDNAMHVVDFSQPEASYTIFNDWLHDRYGE